MDVRKFYSGYMLFIGVFGQLMYYAQAYKIFAAKDAGGVSLFGFCVGFIGVTSWFLYGVMLKDTPLIVANVIAMLGALAVVVGILLYR